MNALRSVATIVIESLAAFRIKGRRFGLDETGNIAVIFAIASLPVMTFLGAAVDYTVASKTRTKLQAMQDAAVLTAVGKLSSNLPPDEAQANAIQFFNAQVSAEGLSASLSLKVTDSGNDRTVTSSFSSDVTTAFLKVVGRPTMTVTNASSAAVTRPSYVDFYMLLDNTPSMGVGATSADIAKMVANTPDKCAFACHDKSDPKNYYNKAKDLGVTMRIDVVRLATQQLTDTATLTASVPNQFRMAVYTFGDSCSSTGLTTISPLSSSLSSVKLAANAIDLMTIPYNNYNNDQCTDFDTMFSSISAAVPTAGSGTSSSPEKFLFFVSDGVADAYSPGNCTKATTDGKRCQEPLKITSCNALKAKGFKIAILYTTYLPLPTNSWYNQWISPFSSQIPNNMESCATPGFYFEVSPTQGISDAMNALFQKAVSRARLTT